MRLFGSVLTAILVLQIGAPTAPAPEAAVITEYKSEEAEKLLWEWLSGSCTNDRIAAGIMGYFWRESFFKSDATTGWATQIALYGIDRPKEFTARIDAGLPDGSTREEFVRTVHEDIGGYGLGQWYGESYLEALYDFAREWGTSIADAQMQCAFVVESMKSIPKFWRSLERAKDSGEAGRLIALLYDGSENGAEYMGEMAEQFYERYSTEYEGSTKLPAPTLN